MPWARCLQEVRNGDVDGIFSVYNTLERQKFLVYAQEVLIRQVQSFFVLKDSPIIFDGDLKIISNRSIGIIYQTSYGPRLDLALKDGTFSKKDFAANAEINVRKLLRGRIDQLPSYRHVALGIAKQLGATNKIKELTPPIESIPSYLAFTKKRNFTNIIKDFNKGLSLLKKDGTYKKIFNKYLD